MDKGRFIAELKRALLNEEEMATTLLDLTSKILREHGVNEDTIKRASGLLDTIKADTTLHTKIVRDMIARLAEGSLNG